MLAQIAFQMNRATLAVTVLAVLALIGCAKDTPEERLAAARAHLAKNEHAAAVIELKNALQANPKLAEARLLLGSSLLQTGDAAGAEKELRRALDLGAPRNEVVPPLAQAMVSLGQFDEVVKQFGAEDVGAPERQADLATSLGQARMGLRQLQEAQGEFTKALSLRPDYAPAMLGSAQLKVKLGDLAGALELTRAAIASAP